MSETKLPPVGPASFDTEGVAPSGMTAAVKHHVSPGVARYFTG